MQGNIFSRLNRIMKAAGAPLLILSSSLALNPALAADDLAFIFDLAAANDPEIRQARAEYNANHTLLAQGRSQLLPTITITGNTSRDTAGPKPIYSYANGFNTQGYGFNIRQNLLNFEAWYGWQAAKKNDQVAAANLARAEQDLILRVANAYFDVLRSLENLASFEAEEAAAERVLEQTRQRFEVGLIPITDVYESQANYDLARVNSLVEENVLSQRYEALEAITGQNHAELEELREDFPIESIEPSGLEEWVSFALANNLDIQAATYNYEAREEEAKSARAAMYPVFDISAGYGWNKSSNPFQFFTQGVPSERTNITLNLSVPLYTGGLNNARKRQAYFNRDASEEILLRTQRTSTQDTRNSYRSVENDVLTVAARQQAIISAESQLEATEVGAEVGTRNIVDVVIAQRLLFQALRDYSNARYDYIINTLNLKRAAGVLNPSDVLELNEWLD